MTTLTHTDIYCGSGVFVQPGQAPTCTDCQRRDRNLHCKATTTDEHMLYNITVCNGVADCNCTCSRCVLADEFAGIAT